MESKAFQNKWEEIYSEGRQLNRYPWDMVVSFIYRNYPKDRPRYEVKILEIGCGSGSNLWFAAREGFSVSGIDGSVSAIKYSMDRFKEEGLKGDFRVGDFSDLPFAEEEFDIVIDRASITCCNYEVTNKIIREVHRVLKRNGKFLFNSYSDKNSSFVSGKLLQDGLVDEISDGSLIGVGKIYFFSKREILNLFKENWEIKSLEHSEIREELNPRASIHADWRVVVEKI